MPLSCSIVLNSYWQLCELLCMVLECCEELFSVVQGWLVLCSDVKCLAVKCRVAERCETLNSFVAHYCAGMCTAVQWSAVLCIIFSEIQ